MDKRNLSIMDLRDIALPEPVGFWPPAPFVWVLVGATGIGLAFLIWRRIVRWRADAYRREALRLLDRIEAQVPGEIGAKAACRELSTLLKRVALAVFPRNQVAPLYGEAWLHFLDSTCNGCTFVKDAGPILGTPALTVDRAAPDAFHQCKNLAGLARKWIAHHRVPAVNTTSLNDGSGLA